MASALGSASSVANAFSGVASTADTIATMKQGVAEQTAITQEGAQDALQMAQNNAKLNTAAAVANSINSASQTLKDISKNS